MIAPPSTSRAGARPVDTQGEGDRRAWIERGRASLVSSFANGIDHDINAVRAAITAGWSNGQTEGQITKLKLAKRQMYGRGKLDLLQARLIGSTAHSTDRGHPFHAMVGADST